MEKQNKGLSGVELKVSACLGSSAVDETGLGEVKVLAEAQAAPGVGGRSNPCWNLAGVSSW